MNIVIATVKVPFISGGAEIHAQELKKALENEGHTADIVEMPFKWYPSKKIIDHILMSRIMDLTESNGIPVDLVIGLKFPAYYARHKNKVLWILHQYRTAYDLWADTDYGGDLIIHPEGRAIKEVISNADKKFLPEASKIFSNSRNVADRLRKFSGVESTPLYHPPINSENLHCENYSKFFFFPSRIEHLKRQDLILEALKYTKNNIVVKFCGSTNNQEYLIKLKNIIKKHKLKRKVKILGTITEEKKIELYANCLGVIYPPRDEDYGYVTLESMLSSKATITCKDSGGPMEFITNNKTGFILDPDPKEIAKTLDYLWENPNQAKKIGKNARKHYKKLGISWKNVVKALTS